MFSNGLSMKFRRKPWGAVVGAIMAFIFLVIFLLSRVNQVQATGDPPVALTGQIHSQSEVIETFSRGACDRLCAEYDRVPQESTCEQLRKCGINCKLGEPSYDFVYIWEVGGGEHRLEYRDRVAVPIKDRYSTCYYDMLHMSRYRELDFFRYAFHSLLKFAPSLVRRVFVVSPLGLTPPWLDLDKMPFVRVVDPQTFIPSKEGYSFFNVNAIMMHLDLLPTLSNPHITMMHNVLLTKPINNTFFFPADSNRATYYVDRYLTGMMRGCWGDNVRKAEAMYRTFHRMEGVRGGGMPVSAHHPFVQFHAVNRMLRRNFMEEFALAQRHPLYHPEDPAFLLLHPWIASTMGYGVLKEIEGECEGDIGVSRDTPRMDLVRVLYSPPSCKFIGLEDGYWENFDTKDHDEVLSFLDGLVFPKKLAREYLWRSRFSQAKVTVQPKTFRIANRMAAVHTVSKVRDSLRRNDMKQDWHAMMRRVGDINLIDFESSISNPTAPVDSVRVTEFNMERGKYLIEFADKITTDSIYSTVRATDFYLLNEMDLGMVRSGNVHTTKVLANILGYNWAWVTEFVELTKGTEAEEKANANTKPNMWGLHGNAILSKWPLSRFSVVRVADRMDEYYDRSPHDKNEIRLGGRVALFAEARVKTSTGDVNVTLVSFHATTKWANDRRHTDLVLAAIRERIKEYGNKYAVFGGDTWTFSCDVLGMTSMVRERVPVNIVSSAGLPALGEKWMDDYICVNGLDSGWSFTPPFIQPIAFQHFGSAVVERLSDHCIVSTTFPVGR